MFACALWVCVCTHENVYEILIAQGQICQMIVFIGITDSHVTDSELIAIVVLQKHRQENRLVNREILLTSMREFPKYCQHSF